MRGVSTRQLKLYRCGDGYWRTAWYDENGKHHNRSFGRKKARAENNFSKFRATWHQHNHVRNPDAQQPLTVLEAWKQYEPVAELHYRRRDGSQTGEAASVAQAMKPLLDLFGDLPAMDFDVVALRRARDSMIEKKWSVNTINQRISKIRRVFRWFASHMIVPGELWHGLCALDPIQPGRTAAPINEEVLPVPEADIWAVVRAVPATIAAMIEVQYLTGARPGEVCRMRAVEIDMTGSVWLYYPSQHKTLHRNKKRVVPIGPKCQEVIQPFLARRIEDYLFKPLEAIRQRHASAKSHRNKPVEPAKSNRKVGEYYDPKHYGACIRKVCKKIEVLHWSPNRLRHNAATRLRKEFGLDLARAVLGHGSADVTELYAQFDMDKAIAAMERVG